MGRLQTVKVMLMQRLSSSASLSFTTRGRSFTPCRRYAVAAPAQLDTSPQRWGRVSKAERRSLVESFVNKYKALNAGKYPTPSHVRSAVGGSYYTVKRIVQELQHESQTPSAGMFHNNPQYETAKKESGPLSSSLGDSYVQMPVCEEITVDTLVGTSSGNEEDCMSKFLSYADHEPSNIDIDSKITRVLERDVEKEVEVTKIVVVNEEKVKSDTKLHVSAVSGNMASGLQEESKEHSSSKDNVSADKEVHKSEEGYEIMATSKISEKLADTKYVPGLDMEPKVYQEESTQVGEFTRNNEKDAEIIKDRNLEDAEIDKISFAWKHMKSLADGILKIWRKF